MNKVILMGRLTRDPEIRYSAGENSTCVARYTLAVDRRFSRGNSNDNDGNNADFIPCVAFGKSGEFAEKYLKKGTKMAVVGRIQTGSYVNKEGTKVYTTEVVVEEQEFAESKNTQNGGGQSGGYSGNSYAQNGGYGQNSGYSQNNSYGQTGAQRGNQQQNRNSGSPSQGQNQGGGSYQGKGRQQYGNAPQGGYRNGSGQQYGSQQQGQYQNGGQYGGAARGQYQQGSMSSDLDGFMNIPDGVEESLPFA